MGCTNVCNRKEALIKEEQTLLQEQSVSPNSVDTLKYRKESASINPYILPVHQSKDRGKVKSNKGKNEKEPKSEDVLIINESTFDKPISSSLITATLKSGTIDKEDQKALPNAYMPSKFKGNTPEILFNSECSDAQNATGSKKDSLEGENKGNQERRTSVKQKSVCNLIPERLLSSPVDHILKEKSRSSINFGVENFRIENKGSICDHYLILETLGKGKKLMKKWK